MAVLDPIRDSQLELQPEHDTDRRASSTADTAHYRQSMRGNGYGAYGALLRILDKVSGNATADQSTAHVRRIRQIRRILDKVLIARTHAREGFV